MKRIFLILVCVMLLGGCATIPAFMNGATSAEKKAAMCGDAQKAYVLADEMIPKVAPGTAAAKYWADYKFGAKLIIDSVCGTQ